MKFDEISRFQSIFALLKGIKHMFKGITRNTNYKLKHTLAPAFADLRTNQYSALASNSA